MYIRLFPFDILRSNVYVPRYPLCYLFADLYFGVYFQLDRRDVVVVMYNDEFPNGTSSDVTHGHAKGVVVFDGHSGFWLVHSVPQFPPDPGESYSMPKSAFKYGQTMMCLSMASNQAELIGKNQATKLFRIIFHIKLL